MSTDSGDRSLTATVAGVTSWQQVSPGGRVYAERFADLERRGVEVHGEADLVERLTPAGARILDAGCGTGRVAIRLRRRGFRAEGVDVDADMLAVARDSEPEIPWYEADLADLRTAAPGPYDVIVAAGNVLPLVADPASAAAQLAARLTPAGLLVAGFGLDAAHLPVSPTLDLTAYDRGCAAAGLTLRSRHRNWQQEPYDGGGYAVSIHAASLVG